MGSEYKKPDATTEITRENYKELLWPLDAGEMFFVGKASAQKLRNIGIKTIGDIAASSPDALSALLGKVGRSLWEHANGIDDSPVMHFAHREKIKSVGNGSTFRRNLTSEEDIRIAVTALSDTVSSRLRKYAMKASGIKVDIKDPDLRVTSRQKQLFAPTNLSSDFVKASMEIIHSMWREGMPVRLITITGIYLVDETEDTQLSLFGGSEQTRKKSRDLGSCHGSGQRKVRFLFHRVRCSAWQRPRRGRRHLTARKEAAKKITAESICRFVFCFFLIYFLTAQYSDRLHPV